MKTTNDSQGDKEEKLGRFVFGISYWLYAIRFIVFTSLAALAPLYFLHKPLWLAPVIGCVVFFVWRSIRRFILKKWFQFLQ